MARVAGQVRLERIVRAPATELPEPVAGTVRQPTATQGLPKDNPAMRRPVEGRQPAACAWDARERSCGAPTWCNRLARARCRCCDHIPIMDVSASALTLELSRATKWRRLGRIVSAQPAQRALGAEDATSRRAGRRCRQRSSPGVCRGTSSEAQAATQDGLPAQLSLSTFRRISPAE